MKKSTSIMLMSLAFSLLVVPAVVAILIFTAGIEVTVALGALWSVLIPAAIYFTIRRTTIKKERRKKRRAMEGMTVIELMIIVGVIAVIAAVAIPNLLEAKKIVEEKEQQQEAEVEKRGATCPFHECEEIWNKKCDSKVCWVISTKENLVSDTLRDLTEEEILTIMAAREKRGFTLITRTHVIREHPFIHLVATLVWRSPE